MIGLSADVAAHAAAAYPREACGLLVRLPSGALAHRPARNLAASIHDFLLDPGTLIAAHRRGEALVALYHSHGDAPAVLSAADRAALMLGDQPAWPGIELWIVPVVAGRPGPIVVYTWSDRVADYVVKSTS